jgi:ribosomal protein S27AE
MSDAHQFVEPEDVEQFDLTCPACGTDLLADATYNDWRVCGRCDRHCWVSGRERASLSARTCYVSELP